MQIYEILFTFWTCQEHKIIYKLVSFVCKHLTGLDTLKPGISFSNRSLKHKISEHLRIKNGSMKLGNNFRMRAVNTTIQTPTTSNFGFTCALVPNVGENKLGNTKKSVRVWNLPLFQVQSQKISSKFYKKITFSWLDGQSGPGPE